jgi:shikimate kinase
MGGHLRTIRNSTGITVGITDKPENILERITFYDIDSKHVEKSLTVDEKRLYLREINNEAGGTRRNRLSRLRNSRP